MRVVLEHGYGYWDRDRKLETQPYTKFRIASISKPLAAVAMLKLIQDSHGRVTLDTKVSDILAEFKNPPSGDPRIQNITIRNLIEHTGGWDISQIGFDPMYDAAHRALVPRPGTAQEIIKYMLTRNLDFNPGTKSVYSNFGYCVLGRVIEALSDMPYKTYLEENVTEPIGMRHTRLGGTLAGGRLPFETRYYDYPGAPLIDSVFDANHLVPWPYGGFYMPAFDSSGGMVSTTTDLLRFLVSMNTGQHAVVQRPFPGLAPFEGDVPPFSDTGQTWQWYKEGSNPGNDAGLGLFAGRPDKPRTYWCFLTNTRPANTATFFSDCQTALNAAILTVEQENHFTPNQGKPLWRPRK